MREVDPHYPDPTAAFVPQFFAGIRTEADAVEHYDRLERRTRETCRLGSWVTPAVIERRAPGRPSGSPRRPTGSSTSVDVLLTPSIAHRPPRVGVLDRTGTVRASLKSLPAIAYAALWNVAGNPACSVPCAHGQPTGCRSASSWSGRPTARRSSSASPPSSRRARPWPLVAPDFSGSSA